MVSFVIFDEDEKMRKMLSLEIKRFLFTTKDHYRIIECSHFDEESKEKAAHLEGTKLYILNVDVPSNLQVAKMIRESGDFISPIILYTKYSKAKIIDSLSNILFLDLIKVDDMFSATFQKSLSEAYKIMTRHSVYSFSIYDEIYRIPYKDIYYIIKNYRDDSVTIYTKDDSYVNYITVKGLDETICKDARFFKTHRSCIINLYNVLTYDRKNNIVVFKNGMTIDLVSKSNRPLLAERLKSFSNSF